LRRTPDGYQVQSNVEGVSQQTQKTCMNDDDGRRMRMIGHDTWAGDDDDDNENTQCSVVKT
jgi:hypothetical protein